MERLVVCSGCRRHFKEHDTRCPFCHHAPSAARSIALVGAVVVGAGLSIAACGGQTTPPDGGADAAPDADGGLLGAYGPPPPQDGGQD